MTYPALSRARRKSQQGSSVILFTMLCSLLLIPVAGLAIDGAVVFLMKAKLSAAVDAAALATARGLSVGSSLAAQTAAATATGDSYFSANLPAGTMGATIVGGAPTIGVTVTAGNTMQASVQATITVPLYLMRIIGFQSVTLSDTGQASRRVSNIILVMDRSYSIAQAGSCGVLISSAQSFVNDFVDGRDTLGLVTFQATANLDYAPSTTFKSGSPAMTTTIGQLQCTGYTNTAEALHLAYTQIKTLNQPLANNVIVLFTDGQPDSFTANFAVSKSQSDTRYDSWNTGTSETVGATSAACTTSINNKVAGVNQGITGVVVDIDGMPDNTGYTGGIFQDTPEPINWVSPYQSSTGVPFPAAVVSASGCNFTSSSPNGYPYDSVTVRDDIPYLPAADIFGNALTGHWASYYSAYPGGTTSPRIDTPLSVMNAAMNAADAQAATIRADTTYNPTIYSIGLGGTPQEPINTDFMERVANDPRSSSYNTSQATGLYIFCTQSGLASAFQQIASQILRLSK